MVIDGKGFAADKVVTFYYDNGVRKILGTQPAGSAGDFSFSFTVRKASAVFTSSVPKIRLVVMLKLSLRCSRSSLSGWLPGLSARY